MKRKYMKPTVRVVELQQRQSLLISSPGKHNNRTIETYRAPVDIIGDGEEGDII